MALKDNLINIVKLQKGEELFGGCAGFGCGSAFNFVALLPNGEIHACRKFPSPIGNINRQSLAEIYDSATAHKYRLGPDECRGCKIRHVCGGCLAVIASQGRDIGKDRDLCCFMEQQP
jgi:radical SAM protein with 4Fe4S-binding SPASM domain